MPCIPRLHLKWNPRKMTIQRTKEMNVCSKLLIKIVHIQVVHRGDYQTRVAIIIDKYKLQIHTGALFCSSSSSQPFPSWCCTAHKAWAESLLSGPASSEYVVDANSAPAYRWITAQGQSYSSTIFRESK